MSEETPAEGMPAKKVHFAAPSARQAVAVSPEANKMTGGTFAATTPGLEGKGATGTTAAAGTAMDVNNDKKRPASSPKRPSSKHRPQTDETQQDVEMKEAEAPRTTLRVSVEDKPNFSGSANKNNLMTRSREGLSDGEFEVARATLRGAGRRIMAKIMGQQDRLESSENSSKMWAKVQRQAFYDPDRSHCKDCEAIIELTWRASMTSPEALGSDFEGWGTGGWKQAVVRVNALTMFWAAAISNLGVMYDKLHLMATPEEIERSADSLCKPSRPIRKPKPRSAPTFFMDRSEKPPEEATTAYKPSHTWRRQGRKIFVQISFSPTTSEPRIDGNEEHNRHEQTVVAKQLLQQLEAVVRIAQGNGDPNFEILPYPVKNFNQIPNDLLLGLDGKDLEARKFTQAEFTSDLYWKLAHRVRSPLRLGAEKPQTGQFLICTGSEDPAELFDRINQTLASEKRRTLIVKSKIQSLSGKRIMAGFFLFSDPFAENREVAHQCLSKIDLDDYGPLKDFELSTGIPSLGWGDNVFERYQWDGTPNSGPPSAIVLWVATELTEKMDRRMAELFPPTDRLDKPLCKPWVYVKKPNNRFNVMNNAMSDVEKQHFRDQRHRQWEYLRNLAHVEIPHTFKNLDWQVCNTGTFTFREGLCRLVAGNSVDSTNGPRGHLILNADHQASDASVVVLTCLKTNYDWVHQASLVVVEIFRQANRIFMGQVNKGLTDAARLLFKERFYIHDHRLYLRESQKTPLSLEHPLHTAIFTNRRVLPIYGHRIGDEETADTDGGSAAGDDVTIPDTTSVQEANREPDEASITAYSTSSMADMSFGRAGRAAATQNDNYSMTTTSTMDNSATELYTTEERMAISGLERLRGREVDTSMQTSDTDSAMTGEPEDDLSISQMAAKAASSSRDNPAGSDEEAFNDDSSNESLPDSKPRASSRPQKKASPAPVQSNRSNEQTSQGRPTQDSGREASTKPPEDESKGGSGTRLAKASTTSPSHAHQASDRDNKTTPANMEAHDRSATRTQEGEGLDQASSEPVTIQEGDTGAAEALAEHNQRLLGLWSQFNDIHQGYNGVILLLERTQNKLLLGTGGGTFLQYWHRWWETYGQSAHGHTDKLDPRNVCLQISLKFLMFLYVCENIDDLDEYWKIFWSNNDYSGILQAAEAIADNPTWMAGLQIDVITSFIPGDDADNYHPEWAHQLGLPCSLSDDKHMTDIESHQLYDKIDQQVIASSFIEDDSFCAAFIKRYDSTSPPRHMREVKLWWFLRTAAELFIKLHDDDTFQPGIKPFMDYVFEKDVTSTTLTFLAHHPTPHRLLRPTAFVEIEEEEEEDENEDDEEQTESDDSISLSDNAAPREDGGGR
jgi:hypothetical protein